MGTACFLSPMHDQEREWKRIGRPAMGLQRIPSPSTREEGGRNERLIVLPRVLRTAAGGEGGSGRSHREGPFEEALPAEQGGGPPTRGVTVG